MLLSAQAGILAQEKTVRGTVSDEAGDPIPGVNILIKGTNRGITTDSEGNYMLSVPEESSVLVFSFIGFMTNEFSVGNQTIINVVLMEDTRQIGEVVVVGYGTQRKKDLTGSIVSVSGEILNEKSVASFDQALQGKVPGMQVTQTTGAPGGNINVLVRGMSSISSGNSPLYVIDGFPIGTGGGGSNMSGFSTGSYSSAGMAGSTMTKINPLSSINPSDIESIEVLKDASATAIYGSRGANGVVIITTKRGQMKKVSINVNTSYGLQQIAKKVRLMNAQEFAAFSAEGRDNAWIYLGGKASDPNSARSNQSTWVNDAFRNPSGITNNTDWQDVIFRTAPVQNYQLSATGGTENIKYMISGGYFNQEGIVIGSNYERFNLRSNIDVQLNRRMKLGTTISGNYGYGDFARTEDHLQFRGLIQCAMAYSPTLPVYDEKGNFSNMFPDPTMAPVDHPLHINNEFSDKRQRTEMLANTFLDIQIIDGLNFRTSIGANLGYSYTKLWKSSEIGQGVAETAPATAGALKLNTFNWLNENTLNYQKVFNDKHNFNLLGGLTLQKENSNLLNAGATSFPTDYVTYISAGQVNAGGNSNSEWSLVSLLARVNYVYDGKYLLTATVRRDGSSRFGSNNRWGTFPSVSVGYRISEEQFMQNIGFVSNLKIRVSYGEAGNNLIGNYAHIGLLSPSNYVNNNARLPGLVTTTMDNDRLTWEKSKQFNIGLDLGLFNERISFVADIYRDYKTELLLGVQLPAASGFNSSTLNIGEIENKGIELGLNTDNIVTKDFDWSTSFNISANRNKVKKLATESNRLISSYHITEAGQPIGSFYLMKVLGVFKDDAEAKSGVPVQSPNTQGGDLIFKDVDGNGSITVNDREIVGSPFPDFIWGMTNSFRYKNLNLSVFLNGSHGNSIYANLGETIINSAGVQNQLEMVNRRWKSPEDPGDGKVPRAIRNNYALGMQASSRMLFDASYIRIKDVTLSYDFPGRVANLLHIQGLNAYINISNLYTFTDYPMYDPEASMTGDAVSQSGIDGGVYPIARTYSVGVKLSF